MRTHRLGSGIGGEIGCLASYGGVEPTSGWMGSALRFTPLRFTFHVFGSYVSRTEHRAPNREHQTPNKEARPVAPNGPEAGVIPCRSASALLSSLLVSWYFSRCRAAARTQRLLSE